MKENFDAAFAAVLRSEGFGVSKSNPYGFANHPKDPGGITQLGVTKRVWEDWVGHPVTVDDMKDLRPDTVRPLYRARFWDKIRADELPSGVDYAAFDLAVNSGTYRAAQMLQRVANVPADGIIGPVTLSAIAKISPDQAIAMLSGQRLAFLKSLPTWETFGSGWSRRVSDVTALAHKMVKTP